jgi:GTP-binding protein
MLPVIALIGRPNVGKSTLFNRLTRSRDALVADYPGLTRDRKYGFGKLGPIPYLVIDTGGVAGGEVGISELMVEQTIRALQEADVAIIMVDGRSGRNSADEHVAELARKHAKKTWLAVNKAEGLDAAIASGEFHSLGLGDPIAVSAAHGDRISALMDEVLAPWVDLEPEAEIETDTDSDEVVDGDKSEQTDELEGGEADDKYDENKPLRIAVIGRPNVGKSTLINRLLGEDRLVVFDQPGTTRDSVAVPFERDGKSYVLIDTAGIRRKSKVHEVVEKFSIIKALQAMERAQVVIAVLDAQEGVTEQDVSLLGLTVERGRALVVVANKWDGLSRDQRRQVKSDLDRRLPFLEFATQMTISALHGTAVGDLLPEAEKAYRAATRDLQTRDLNEVLEEAVIAHSPPLVRGRRIKLRYAHQGGRNPPVIVIHGNQTEKLPEAYRRYLINKFRKVFKLKGTPVRLAFKSSENPFKGRRNKLTPRQLQKRKRLMKHVKR